MPERSLGLCGNSSFTWKSLKLLINETIPLWSRDLGKGWVTGAWGKILDFSQLLQPTQISQIIPCTTETALREVSGRAQCLSRLRKAERWLVPWKSPPMSQACMIHVDKKDSDIRLVSLLTSLLIWTCYVIDTDLFMSPTKWSECMWYCSWLREVKTRILYSLHLCLCLIFPSPSCLLFLFYFPLVVLLLDACVVKSSIVLYPIVLW